MLEIFYDKPAKIKNKFDNCKGKKPLFYSDGSRIKIINAQKN